MRVFRFLSLLLVPAAALALSACSTLYARDLHPANSGDPDPKVHECSSCVQHARDSVFHSYMDSLDYRISALNDVARRVDSLSKLFKDHPKWKLFMDGKTFGPMHFPETHFPGTKLSSIEIPEFTIPEVNIPSIEIPEIDINLDTSNLSAITAGAHKLAEWADNFTISGNLKDIESLGDGVFIGHADLNAVQQPSSDSYYNSDSKQRYYIRNAPPTQKAKRAKPEGNIWLLNAK